MINKTVLFRCAFSDFFLCCAFMCPICISTHSIVIAFKWINDTIPKLKEYWGKSLPSSYVHTTHISSLTIYLYTRWTGTRCTLIDLWVHITDDAHSITCQYILSLFWYRAAMLAHHLIRSVQIWFIYRYYYFDACGLLNCLRTILFWKTWITSFRTIIFTLISR